MMKSQARRFNQRLVQTRQASAGGGLSGLPPARIVSVPEAGTYFGFDCSTVRYWIQKLGCPVYELGSVGRGCGSRLNLDDVERWRIARLVPTCAAKAQEDVLAIVERALLDSLKRDDLANRTKMTGAQAALAVLIIFERAFKNLKQQPLEHEHVPEQLRNLCAIHLDSVERGTF